jgi:hypothetical protein
MTQGFCWTLGALVTLVMALGTVSPALAEADTVIHACVNASSGAIQVVGPHEQCKKNWGKLHWNVVGPTGPQGPDGVCTNCTTVTPPTIVHDAPAVTSKFDLDITFEFSDDGELNYYIVQGDSSPFVQLTSYLEPGVSSASVVHTLSLHSGINKFLVTAVDTQGNAGKALIVVEHVVGE